MTILTTSYNCEQYIRKSLLSIKNQNYTDFICYITDDMSTDSTIDTIKNIIKDDKRFILIENKKKLYQIGNYDQIIKGKNILDDEICIEVDGDDWLANPNVFSQIKSKYDNGNVWMTSGSFIYHDGRQGFANPPRDSEDVRNQHFTLSHIRTWKSWLWKKIKEEDVRDENGNYWDIAGDLAFMFPMYEMAGKEHYLFLPEISYVYNESNPLNEHKVDMQKVLKTVDKIRSKQPYQKI